MVDRKYVLTDEQEADVKTVVDRRYALTDDKRVNVETVLCYVLTDENTDVNIVVDRLSFHQYNGRD